MSSYLAFRHVAELAAQPGSHAAGIIVSRSDEIEAALRAVIANELRPRSALFLSGGIDSAILAALLPKTTLTYSIVFDAPGAIDESVRAAVYAKHLGLEHRRVIVTSGDYERLSDELILAKGAPLHAVEVGLHVAALAARRDGFDHIVVGNGADSTFGGLDKLLSRDWSFDEFVERYSFVDPAAALVDPRSIRAVYEPYRRGSGIDVVGFLKIVHGRGITESFQNALSTAGCQMIEPYERLTLGTPLDVDRIRRGESKYLLREVFRRLYPGLELPEKIAFARPMDRWLAGHPGPKNPAFRGDLAFERLSGEQRFLLLSLDRHLSLEARHAAA